MLARPPHRRGGIPRRRAAARKAQGPAAAARLPRATPHGRHGLRRGGGGRDLLRHENSNLTRAIYRRHFNDKRRELLRERLAARPGSSEEALDRNAGQQWPRAEAGEATCMQGFSRSGQQAATPRALMVRKGSPVRVRQRAPQKPSQTAGFVVQGRSLLDLPWEAVDAFGRSWRREGMPRSGADCRQSPSSARSRRP
jgi:hypothetical protein